MGGGERDPVRSSKTWASPGQGALPSLGAAGILWWCVNRLLLQGHWLVPVKDVLGVGIPYVPLDR